MKESVHHADYSAESAGSQSIVFEPGIHPRTKSQGDTVMSEFYRGNLAAHIWNPQVAVRMKEYSPYVIAVDGDVPLVQPHHFTFSDKLSIWLGLPARPSEINPVKKEVVAVLGDSVLYNQGLIPVNEEYPHDVRNDLHQSFIKTQESELFNTYADLYSDALCKLSIGLLTSYGLAAAAERLPDSKKQKQQEVFSRRKFLQYSAASAYILSALYTTAAPVSSSISALTLSKRKDIWSDIAEFTRPTFVKPLWCNARTALLLAKAEDAKSILNESSPASVVMGTAHTFEADILTNDRLERDHLIGQFAEYLLNIIDTVIDNQYPSLDKAPAHKAMLDYLAKADLVQIKDPGGPDQTSNAKELVDKSITHLQTFLSPQIVKATSYLA